MSHSLSASAFLSSAAFVSISFLRAFEGGDRPSVSLDAVAKELKVERRRIYDIVNILEAVAVVRRSGKNAYSWHGTTLLAERISALNAAMQDSEAETGGALKRGMAAMNKAMMRPDSGTAAGDDGSHRDGSESEADVASTDEVMADLAQRNMLVLDGHYPASSSTAAGSDSTATNTANSTSAGSTTSSPTAAPSTSTPSPQQQPQPGGDASSSTAGSAVSAKKKKASSGRDVRREQSLGHLSAVFVQMFLANDARVVSLEEAARWLLRSSAQQQQTTTSQQQQQQHNQQQSDSDEQMAAATGGVSATASTERSSGSAGRAKSADSRAASLFKSKVRRLYDIANVLSSLKLIEKIQLIQSRRPAFRWLGANVYPLDSTISSDAFTTNDGPNRNKGDTAAKRRTPSKQQQQQQQQHDGSSSAARIKQEAGAADNGNGGMSGGGSSSGGGGMSGSTLLQTLHSAFSTPGSLAVRTQPLSFSFSKTAPSVITPTGPSLSHVPGSANALHSNSAFASVPSSASAFPSSSSSSATAPLSSLSALGSSPSSSFSSSSVPSSARGGAAVYWFVHHDRSFSMDASKMAEFDPLDFAYLPYIAPPGLHDAVQQLDKAAKAAAASASASPSSSTPATPLPLPPHVAELPPSVQAAYVRDTGGFLSAFSAACKRWKELIPGMANQQPQHTAGKRMNGSAALTSTQADISAAPSASAAPSPSEAFADASSASSSSSSSSGTSTTAPRGRRSAVRSNGSSSSSSGRAGR